MEILKIASQHPLTKEFMRENPLYKSKVTFLDETALRSLIATSPAIYSNINSKEIYKVEYNSEKEGIMLLIDPTTKTVVKYFRVKEIKV
ncbi:MAG: hypothetical protein QW802_04955 [Candidatus Altiarchaeota archaeon]